MYIMRDDGDKMHSYGGSPFEKIGGNNHEQQPKIGGSGDAPDLFKSLGIAGGRRRKCKKTKGGKKGRKGSRKSRGGKRKSGRRRSMRGGAGSEYKH